MDKGEARAEREEEKGQVRRLKKQRTGDWGNLGGSRREKLKQKRRQRFRGTGSCEESGAEEA